MLCLECAHLEQISNWKSNINVFKRRGHGKCKYLYWSGWVDLDLNSKRIIMTGRELNSLEPLISINGWKNGVHNVPENYSYLHCHGWIFLRNIQEIFQFAYVITFWIVFLLWHSEWISTEKGGTKYTSRGRESYWIVQREIDVLYMMKSGQRPGAFLALFIYHHSPLFYFFTICFLLVTYTNSHIQRPAVSSEVCGQGNTVLPLD